MDPAPGLRCAGVAGRVGDCRPFGGRLGLAKQLPTMADQEPRPVFQPCAVRETLPRPNNSTGYFFITQAPFRRISPCRILSPCPTWFQADLHHGIQIKGSPEKRGPTRPLTAGPPEVGSRIDASSDSLPLPRDPDRNATMNYITGLPGKTNRSRNATGAPESRADRPPPIRGGPPCEVVERYPFPRFPAHPVVIQNRFQGQV